MAKTAKPLAAEEFDQAAKHCRWSEKSLAAARALLVDGATTGEVAKQFDMSPNQAWVLRRRFLDIHSKAKAQDFMQRQQAGTPSVSNGLETFRAAIITLSENGYSDERIAEFLAENDLKVTADAVRQFLDIHRGQK